MTNADMNKIAHDLMETRAMIAELEQEAEALTDWLKEEMTSRGEDQLIGDCWKCSYKTVTSSRLDTKALKAALPEIVQQYTKTTVASRFTITA
jgi:predicted phage-related endonuclease